MTESDYHRGYRAGVAASESFLIEAADQPTYAEELRRYVMPSRQWKRRLQQAVLAPRKVSHD